MKRLAQSRAFALASPAVALAVAALALAGGGGGCSSPDGLDRLGSSAAALGADVTAGLVISQVYGGGGNTGATYTADFVELFNAGTASASVMGMSVQYASAASGTWKVTPLSDKMIPAGGYYLVAMTASGSGMTLPTADDTGTTDIAETGGKVALVNNTTALSCTMANMPNACVASAVDLVGYGNSLDYAGSGPTGALSATTAALRHGAGCTETEDNKNDFAESAPTPRNSATTVMVCGTSPADGGAEGGTDSGSDGGGGSGSDGGSDAGSDSGSGGGSDAGTVDEDSGSDADSGTSGDDDNGDDDDDSLGNPDAGNNSGIVPISDANSASCSSVGGSRARDGVGGALSFGVLSLVTFALSRRRRRGRALRRLP